ncbi:MAG: SPOR domain-containing protein [Deltaproteobacteria bacterium]|nr:SPOR domain-containing protein [Deltaproteobacteria bacterium]
MVSRNRQNFEFKLGKGGIILFTFCMSLLLFVVFLFGVMVGKNMDTYPERYSRGIPALLKDKLGFLAGRTSGGSSVRRETKEAIPVPEGDVDYTFYDTLAGRKDEGKKPAPVTSKVQEGSTKQPEGVKPDTAATPTVGGQVTGTTGLQGPVPMPVKEAKPHGNETYVIQAASYQQKEKAESLGRKIAALGYVPRVVMTDIPSKGRWYRVMMEGFESRQLAEQAAGVVEQRVGGLKCTIRAAKGERE